MPALSSIVDIVGGGTPSKQNPAYWGGDIPWVSVKDLKSSSIDGSSEYITSAGVKNSATTIIPRGNLIVPTRMALGKVAVNTVNVAINQDLKALLIKDDKVVDRDYLMRVLESKASEIEKKGKGATVKGITLDVLRDLDIPLPPLETQKQIAAILEKADQLRKDCQQMEHELNNLAQSVFMDMFGDPVSNPKGFPIKLLPDLADIQIGPFGTQLHKSDYVKGGVPLINPTHIREGKIIPDTDLTVAEEKYRKLTQYHLQVGDIIMGRRGEMGRTAIIDESTAGYFCGTGSLFLRPKSGFIDVSYLNSVLSSPSMISWLESQCLGATMPNLNKGILGKIEIPIPSEKIQSRYQRAKSELLVRKKAQHEEYLQYTNLFTSLMQKAFSGELKIKNKAA